MKGGGSDSGECVCWRVRGMDGWGVMEGGGGVIEGEGGKGSDEGEKEGGE